MAMLSERAFSSVSHSSVRKNPFYLSNIESERDGPAAAGTLSEHSNFRFESSSVPIVCYLRKRGEFRVICHFAARRIRNWRESQRTQCQGLLSHWRRENKSRKKPTREPGAPSNGKDTNIFPLFIAGRLMFAPVGNLCRRRKQIANS
jgi:hypothetical protein